MQAVLREIRFRAGDKKDAEGKTLVAAGDWDGYKVHIVSRNTFPTAAGLASSAAGYACLTQALADLFAVSETYPGELTTIARMGSGSACRSLYGGFVRWSMGEAADGKDSMAVQVAPETHWPELRVLVCVVSDKKKDTGSTPGMVASVKTSELLAHRATAVVPKRLADIEAAFLAKDFETFGRITMADSNQFHATCLDTFPPIFYMNDTSRHIIGLVHTLNKVAGRTVAAYTFDAGPNAVIYTLDADMHLVLAAILSHFPAGAATGTATGSATAGLDFSQYVSSAAAQAAAEAVELPAGVAAPEGSACPGEIRHIYCTSMGDGPRTLPLEEALADPATGLPK